MNQKADGRKSVKVRIFGEDYVIKGSATSEYITRLANLLDAQLEEAQKANPTLPRHKVAILVALNTVAELDELKDDHENLLALLDEAN